MKQTGLLIAAAFCVFMMSAIASAQAPITYYDFENNVTRTTFENAVEQQINSGGGPITRAGLTTTITGVAGAGTFNGGTATGQAATSTNWDAATVDPGVAATNYYQFVVNTSGFSGLSLIVDNQASATGPARIGVLYSTNGTTFTAVGTALTGNAAFSKLTADLSGIAAINNQPSVTIRLYAFAGSAADRTGRSAFASTGTFRIDNLQVSALSTVAGAGTKTLLNELNLYTSVTSGLTGSVFNRGNFTITGAGTTVALSSAVAVGTGSTWTVTNSGTLSFGTAANALISTGNFALNSGATLQINSANGITSIANAGNIQVTGTRTFDPGANYVYNRNATGAQVTGNQLPTTITGSLTVALGASANAPLTLTQSTTVNGPTAINAGSTFDTGANIFATGAGVTISGVFQVTGTFQINTGGFTSGSPTYGSSSLLKYNTGGNYGRNGEWLPGAVSGAGYPANVQLSSNTTLDLPNGSTTQPFQMAGTLTIDAGSMMQMAGATPLTQPLNVLGSININGTLNLSTSVGGDIKVGGNWTRNSATGIFTPNGRAVFFNGSTTQTTALTTAGTETFNYLIVDKPAGNLTLSASPATSIVVNAAAGDVLQLLNAGGIDLNGNTLSLQNNGGNILVSGGVRTISSNTAAFVAFNGSKTVTSSGGGTLVFDGNVTVQLFNSVNFGPSLTTINPGATLAIKSGGSVNTNPPTYFANSTLAYDCGCTYGRGPEWSATSGPGYPFNVRILTGTTLDLGNGGPGVARALANVLSLEDGGLSMALTPMTASLTVGTSVVIVGTGSLTLSTQTGGDLLLGGNFSKAVTSTFTPNGRAVFFNGTGTQTIAAPPNGSVAFDYLLLNKTSGSVQLTNDASVAAPNGGSSLQFNGGAGDVLDINGQTFTINSGTIGGSNAAGAFKGSSTSNMVLNGTGPLGTLKFTSGNEQLQNLTLNRTSGGSATLGSALNINGGANALTLTAGILNTGGNTLTMGGNATSGGAHNGADASYVVGTMKKIYDATPKNFTFDLGTTGGPTDGYTPAAVNAQAGTGDVTATVVNAHHPTLTGSSLRRYWSLTNNGITQADLAFNYLDGDLPATPPESSLVTFKIDGGTAVTPVGSAVNPATNQITMTGATSFSDWTAGAPNAPTAVKMASFEADADEGGVLVRWQTGREVDNLGFNLLREDGRGRTRVTPSIVAGSALMAGPQTTLTAGNSYSWWDKGGRPDSRYYLEDIDLGGKRTLHGPITPGTGKARLSAYGNQATLLSELRPSGAAATASFVQGRPATMNEEATAALTIERAELSPAAKGTIDSGADPLAQQRAIASGQAIKLQVRRNGWYQVGALSLVAAGLDPQADQSLLQLYADGVEQPILIRSDNDRTLGQTGRIEFYGKGLDTLGTDARTYWLVLGTQPGKRITTDEGTGSSVARDASRVDGANSIGGPQSFSYTVERRDRVVFFAALHNGDAENFFGPVINTTSVAQTLDVRAVSAEAAAAVATLEVALQGATAQTHQVRVKLNGTDLGLLSFNAQEHQVAQLSVPQSSLIEGQNTVTLTAEGGETDVSVVDYVRLTYARRYVAENDSLTFSMAGRSAVTVGGFTRQQVNVYDITDPFNVRAVEGKVQPQGAGFAVKVPGTSGPARTLIALADDRAEDVADVSANKPSTLTADNHAGADLVILTHGAFMGTVEPLAQLRRNEGLQVAVVDVEDVYDEFSYGAHSTEAVKAFLSWASANWQTSPRYVMLVGDASLDPRNYLGYGNQDYVPTRMVDSAFLETASDDALADFDNDGLAEMAVGRLPVRTPTQAEIVVGKIVGYQPGVSAQGALLVSDHNDGYNFEGVNQQVRSLLPAGMDVSVINRGNNPPEQVRGQILSALNQGPQVVNFVGHGSVEVWTGAGLFNSTDASNLSNGNRLPLFISMTCLNGYFHDLNTESLAEALLKAEHGGAVAAWASSGLSQPAGQAAMNQQLIQALFGNANSPRLGDAVRSAKTATDDRDVRRTWILFGDPTMRLR